ncbi:putative membrane protein YesL [Anaerotaenia torta]|uniref:YesL family protein n=1 Tax=Anaerotaenia torta TaxID=433293 RepID=UPI003D24C18B
MGNLFNMDNPFFTALAKICDVIFLSLVWALVCIPLITIGPANTALYYTTVKVIRRERGYLTREFFKSFKLNFKRAAIIGVVLTIAFVILGFDLIWGYANMSTGTAGSILFGIFVAITFLLVAFAVYVFPVLSRFDMTVKQLVKAGAFMSIRHLPSTVVMIVITAAGILGVFLIPILIFVIPAAVTFLNSLLMERVLKKYMPKPEELSEDETPSKDEWYLE